PRGRLDIAVTTSGRPLTWTLRCSIRSRVTLSPSVGGWDSMATAEPSASTSWSRRAQRSLPGSTLHSTAQRTLAPTPHHTPPCPAPRPCALPLPVPSAPPHASPPPHISSSIGSATRQRDSTARVSQRRSLPYR